MAKKLLFALVVTAGCGSPDARPAQTPVAPVAAAPVADYEVHEWGLVRADAHDVLQAGVIAPPVEYEVMAVDKPVLYFHAGAALQVRSVDVTPTGGVVREHWPVVALGALPSAVRWSSLSLEPGRACPVLFASATDPPCNTLPAGETCESSSLGTVIANDATCVTGASGLSTPFLFYRSDTRTFTPPLRVTRVGDAIRVINAGDQPIPGFVIRLRSGGGMASVGAVRAPGPNQTADVSLGALVDGDVDDRPVNRRGGGNPQDGRDAVRRTMTEIGLTEPEIAAFLRSWDEALFSGQAVTDGLVDRLGASDESELVQPVDSILYFLPEASCDQVARLAFDPPPRAVHRALAVWARIR